MQDNVAIDDRATYQMVSNLNMPDFSHPLAIRRNAKAGLGVSVDRVGFRAEKTQKPKHVLHMNKLLTADTGSDKFCRASRIHVSSLWDRALSRSPRVKLGTVVKTKTGWGEKIRSY